MLLQIDTDTRDLLYSQITQLEGREYELRFAWSTRESAWYLDISDVNGIPLAQWVRIVVGVSLLSRFQSPGLAPGRLVALDMTGAGLDIATPDELGQRVPLIYITSDDVLVTG